MPQEAHMAHRMKYRFGFEVNIEGKNIMLLQSQL